MPTQLANGVMVVNVTPHQLLFQVGDEVVTVPSDEVINASVRDRRVSKNERFELVQFEWLPTREGLHALARLRQQYPEAVIVGSVIAAQAFAPEVVAPVATQASRLGRNPGQTKGHIKRSDRFVIYPSKQEMEQ